MRPEPALLFYPRTAMPNPNQPGPYDAVLGGAPNAPRDGVVLGGLDGVRQQLRAPDATVRAAALPKALTYGEAGLDPSD